MSINGIKAINQNYKNRIHSQLLIEDNNLEWIEEDYFGDNNCDEIFIRNCPKLRQIHWNAFGKQNHKLSAFYALKELPNLKSNPNTNYDLIKLINSFVNCQFLVLTPFNHLIQPIKLNKLKRLYFNGTDSLIKIISICDYAFYECDQLELIFLSNNNINNISENAFSFSKESNEKFRIYLDNNNLDQSSFAINSLTKIKRPTEMYLCGNQIKYLDEKVFKAFLDANQNNTIQIDKGSFENTTSRIIIETKNQWTKHIHFKRIHIK